ncbi:MAG: class II aldolase/adducin family protein [Candidatus Cloacimonadota bacterium]|nr:class II aldolase/adducin family protein [Candidatus Cloacimonadota bacterium]
MTKKYSGTKFTTIFLSKKIPSHSQIEKLKKWCNIFAEQCLSPAVSGGGFGGNLSFRSHGSFIITASGANLKNMKSEDFVEVSHIKGNKVFVTGNQEPSSEAILHYAIYTKRADVNAIFHGHHLLSKKVAEKFEIPITKHKQPYGTYAQIKEVLAICDKQNFVLIKDHGFLTMAADMESAGKIALGYISECEK